MNHEKPLVVLITSTRSGTGKTLLALSLTLYYLEQQSPVVGVDLNSSNPDFSRILFTLMGSSDGHSPNILDLLDLPYPFYWFQEKGNPISVVTLSNPYYPLASEEIWALINEIVKRGQNVIETRFPRSKPRDNQVKVEGNGDATLNRMTYILETNLNLTSLCMAAAGETFQHILENADIYIFHVWSITPFLSKHRLEPILDRMFLTSRSDQQVHEELLKTLADEVKVLYENLPSSEFDRHVVNIFTPKFYHVEKTWPLRLSDSKSFLTEEQEDILKHLLPISSSTMTLSELSKILEKVASRMMESDAAYLWGAEGLISELFGELVSDLDMRGYQPANVILIPRLRLNAHRLSDFMTITTEVTRRKTIMNLREILDGILQPLKHHLEVLTREQREMPQEGRV